MGSGPLTSDVCNVVMNRIFSFFAYRTYKYSGIVAIDLQMSDLICSSNSSLVDKNESKDRRLDNWMGGIKRSSKSCYGSLVCSAETDVADKAEEEDRENHHEKAFANRRISVAHLFNYCGRVNKPPKCCYI